MKVCFILPSLEKKGPIQVAYDIIVNLNKEEGIDIRVYYFRDSDSVTLDFPVECQKIGFLSRVNLTDYDIVHSHMLKPDLFVFLSKFRQKFKAVSTFHQFDYTNLKFDYNSRFKAYIVSLIWRMGMLRHNHVVYLTKSMREYYRHKHFFSASSVIYNGRSFPDQTNEVVDTVLTFDRKHTFSIGTACLLTRRKGLHQVLFALKELEYACFHIIGDGPEYDALYRLSQELGVSEQVFFHGFVKEPSVLLKQLDAFVLPSYGEGFPLALLEAASLKLACVCSRISTIENVFSDKEVCFFNLDDTSSLIKAIELANKSKPYYSNNIFSLYQSSLTAEKMAQNYLHLYKTLYVTTPVQKN